jgi:tetratricopeptide (TPR) repeat protein
VSRFPLAVTAIVVAVAGGLSPTPVTAQEFIRQRLLVHNFDAGRGSLGRRLGDAIAGAIDHGRSKDLSVVGRGDMLRQLEKAGYNSDSVLLASEIRDQTRRYRADEYVVGRALTNGRAIRLEGLLVLTRDSALKQPIATIELPDVDPAADAFAAEVLRARLQLIPVRRCENALRSGNPRDAAAFALEGIKAYPRATIARACLLRAYSALGHPADSLLRVANSLIALDSTSTYGWEASARANDELGNKNGAGHAWNALATLQAHDADVIARAVTALMRDGNPAIAKPIIARAVVERPEDEHLAGLHWRVLLATEDWENATKVGESLRKLSPTYETQPDYFARMASAYRNANQPFRAIAIAAEGVALHPEDAELYLLYTQLVLGENEAALVRGLERFPKSGKLLALDAQLKRKRGDLQGALDATRKAVAQDSTLTRSYLQLAQAFIDVDQNDSALVVLKSGLKTVADSAVVAQFALGRGNAMYRAANTSKKRADFELALRYLQLSQHLAPSPNAGFLIGSASFGVAQLAATELVTVKSCTIATLAQDNLIVAETEFASNGQVAPDAAKQFLDYASQLHPYVAQQVKTMCTASPAP